MACKIITAPSAQTSKRQNALTDCFWICLPALAVRCVVWRSELTSLPMPDGFRNWKSVVLVLFLWKPPKTRIKDGKNDQDKIPAKAPARANVERPNNWFLLALFIGTLSIALLPGKSPQSLHEAGRDGQLQTTFGRAKPLCAHVWRPHGVRIALQGLPMTPEVLRKVFRCFDTSSHVLQPQVIRFAAWVLTVQTTCVLSWGGLVTNVRLRECVGQRSCTVKPKWRTDVLCFDVWSTSRYVSATSKYLGGTIMPTGRTERYSLWPGLRLYFVRKSKKWSTSGGGFWRNEFATQCIVGIFETCHIQLRTGAPIVDSRGEWTAANREEFGLWLFRLWYLRITVAPRKPVNSIRPFGNFVFCAWGWIQYVELSVVTHRRGWCDSQKGEVTHRSGCKVTSTCTVDACEIPGRANPGQDPDRILARS